jgi:hypothetical protein
MNELVGNGGGGWALSLRVKWGQGIDWGAGAGGGGEVSCAGALSYWLSFLDPGQGQAVFLAGAAWPNDCVTHCLFCADG